MHRACWGLSGLPDSLVLKGTTLLVRNLGRHSLWPLFKFILVSCPLQQRFSIEAISKHCFQQNILQHIIYLCAGGYCAWDSKPNRKYHINVFITWSYVIHNLGTSKGITFHFCCLSRIFTPAAKHTANKEHFIMNQWKRTKCSSNWCWCCMSFSSGNTDLCVMIIKIRIM